MDAILTVVGGRAAGEIFELAEGQRASIGRTESADFQIIDEGVSRTHCLVENKGDRVLATDLGSSNGTFVNDQPMVSTYLHDHDKLRMGVVIIEVRLKGHVPKRVERRTTLSLVKSDEDTAAISRRLVDINATMMMAAPSEAGTESADLTRAHGALKTLYQVGNAINAEHDLAMLFGNVVDSVLEATGAERVAILVHDPETGAIEPAAAKHKGGGQETHLKVSRTVVDEVLREGVSAISTDASEDDRFKGGQSIIMQKIRSVMCVPLASKDAILGALYVDTTDARRKFGQEDLELLAAIGAQAGVAIERGRLIENLESLFTGAIRALVASVEARDLYTRGHSERVTAYSLAISDVLGLPAREREIIELSGLLHDVGKIGVPENVLNKPGKLTDEEFDIIKLHPVQGEEIVRNIHHHYIDEVADSVRHHHERWDGKGYPDGGEADDICMISRILAVADAYDAMTSDRPYRKGFPGEKAVGIIKEVAGSQLDPVMVEAFLKAQGSGAIAEAADAGKSKYAAEPGTATGNYKPVGGQTPPPSSEKKTEPILKAKPKKNKS